MVDYCIHSIDQSCKLVADKCNLLHVFKCWLLNYFYLLVLLTNEFILRGDFSPKSSGNVR